jgi:ferredoxin-NADP reductase
VSSVTVPVRRVSSATPRARLIDLDCRHAALVFAAGQAVKVGLHDSPVRKPYSIASAPWELAKTGVLQLLALVDETGGPDPHLELASPGTLIDIEGPFGSFGLPDGLAPMPVLLVAGGTGIAPLRSILMERLSRPHVPAISVVYSARSAAEFAFKAELDALAVAGRVRLWLTVSRPDTAWTGLRGRVDERLLREALPSREATCFVCGPLGFVTDVSTLLGSLGVDESRILAEK